MLRGISLVTILLAICGICRAEEIEGVTEDHLRLNIPNFFSWDYTFKPDPGKRLWMRVDDKTFIERYASGKENKFKIVGRITIEKTKGTLVQIDAGKLQAFVPDKESEPMYLKMRGDENSGWGHMGEMKKIE